MSPQEEAQEIWDNCYYQSGAAWIETCVDMTRDRCATIVDIIIVQLLSTFPADENLWNALHRSMISHWRKVKEITQTLK